MLNYQRVTAVMTWMSWTSMFQEIGKVTKKVDRVQSHSEMDKGLFFGGSYYWNLLDFDGFCMSENAG